MAGEHLTGKYRVRSIHPALGEAYKLCNKWSENAEIRRHSLKLRYWPENHPMDDSGKILDLDWQWIKSMPRMNVGELRIDDVIAGNDNLRIIFFVGDSKIRKPLPMIWILRVMQKSRDDFSPHDISIFKARRLLVLERFY
jgi:hypothetical protein